MLRTFESVLALVVIFGSFLLFTNINYNSADSLEALRYEVQQAVFDLKDIETVRGKILAVDDSKDIDDLRNELNNHFTFPYEVEVCTLDNTCWGSKPETTNYATVNFIVDSNVQTVEIRKVRIYTWVFRGVDQ